MNSSIWLSAGLVGLCWGLCPQEQPGENDPRFHELLLSAAKQYELYGRVDDVLRFAPGLCRRPDPEPVRLSASPDADTHGQKLYFLYAWDAAAYLKSTRKDFSKAAHAPPLYGQTAAEQVLVKQAWTCVPAKGEGKGDDRARFLRRKGDRVTTGEQKDLFMMIRLPERTPGSDRGWVYGSVAPDGKRVTSAGRVPSCMGCHQTAGDGRLFGLPNPRGEGNDRVLFDFEKDSEAAAWTPLEAAPEPPAKIERSSEGALRVTFAGGKWPSISTSVIPGDWSAWKSLAATVNVGRSCLVGFQVVQEKSLRNDGWDGVISRWARTVFLHPGKNELTLSLEDPSGNGYGLNPKRYGKATSLEIFFYAPRPGESMDVDAIRLLEAKPAPGSTPAPRFKVSGTEWEVANIKELGQKLKATWTPPGSRTLEQVEADFRTQAGKILKEHPKAVLATFREGENGFAGWRDAHINSHGPDTNTEARVKNTGGKETDEAFMRHRSLMFRVDLSAIPQGSTIHGARFVLVAADTQFEKGRDPRVDANMWVAEPCRRPWVEAEVNAYEYAKDKFWKAVGGMHYGEDPDFHPAFLAHGPGNAPVSDWDFTEAVRFWTDGRHENHGFMLHGDSFHYMGKAHCRESKEVRNRPALLVVYEPK